MKAEKLDPIMKDVALAAMILEVIGVDLELGMVKLPVCLEAAILIQMEYQEWNLAKVFVSLAERLTAGMAEIDRVTGECAVQVQVHQELAATATRAKMVAQEEARRANEQLGRAVERMHDRARELASMRARIDQMNDAIDALEQLNLADRLRGYNQKQIEKLMGPDFPAQPFGA